MLVLTDSQKVPLSAAFKTKAGNPAQIEGDPTWASSNESVIQLRDDNGVFKAFAVGLGQAQVSVTGDADLGEGVKNVTGTLDIEVRPGEAVSASIDAGAPEEQE